MQTQEYAKGRAVDIVGDMSAPTVLLHAEELDPGYYDGALPVPGPRRRRRSK